MKFLPYENISYKTQMPAHLVMRLIWENVEPSSGLRVLPTSSAKPYEGAVAENSFTISRLTNSRHAGLPRISGVVRREFNGTSIKVKMYPHPLALVVVSIFFAFFGFLAIFALLIARVFGVFFIGLIPAIIIPLLVYALLVGGFKSESRRTKESLRQLFQARIESDSSGSKI